MSSLKHLKYPLLNKHELQGSSTDLPAQREVECRAGVCQSNGSGAVQYCGKKKNYLTADLKTIKQRNKTFIKNILVILLNNFISTNKKEVNFLFSIPIGPNKIVQQEKKEYSWWKYCFVVLLFLKSTLRVLCVKHTHIILQCKQLFVTIQFTKRS